MKNKLVDTLGGIGALIFYIISVAVYIFPFVMIRANFLLEGLFFLIDYIFPPASVIFWIWGLVCAIQGVQDVWAIIYYVLFAIMFVPFFVSVISSFFRKGR